MIQCDLNVYLLSANTTVCATEEQNLIIPSGLPSCVKMTSGLSALTIERGLRGGKHMVYSTARGFATSHGIVM